MINYTNETGIGLSVAAWLAHDDYDYNDDDRTISTTSLIKPVRQIVLGTRLPPVETKTVDISNVIASRIGTAIHEKIETVWTHNYKDTLASLGYPKKVIESIRINPTAEDLEMYEAQGYEIVPVYMEQRSTKTVKGWTVSGKFDFVAEGILEDFKSTKTYTHVNRTNEAKQLLQGSIYRWLNPEIITSDVFKIQYIFTDWKAFEYTRDPKNYPPQAAIEYRHRLMSLKDTDKYVNDKLIAINTLMDAEEVNLPLCTAEDLWQKETVWKYYKVAANAGVAGKRSTKNFATELEARKRLSADGNVGKVLEVKGQVTACKYCDVFELCSQKDSYIANGTLTV